MSSSNRAVVALFALAVVAALGAVAWLVLGSTPPAEAPPPIATIAKPPVPTGKPPLGHKPPRPEHLPPGPAGRPAVTNFVVAGLVKGPDGAPVPEADVVLFTGAARELPQAPAPASAEKVPPETLRELFSLEPDELAGTNLYSGVPALPTGAPAAAEKEVDRAKTGADGTFRITLKSRGPFRVDARKEGVGHAVATDVAAGQTDLVLTLGPAATLAGRVLASAGTPVEGAVVVIRSGSTVRGATAGADGAFSVPDLAPGRYALDAGAPGFAPTSLPSVEVPAAAPLDVVLGAGYAARVTVTKRELPAPPPPGTPRQRGGAMPQGAPLDGALVVLFHRQSRTYRSALTGPDGIARIDRLGAGRWTLAARKEGFMVGIGKEIAFKVGSPPEESREVRMIPSVPTPVRVLDEAGSPIRNAKVYTGGLDVEYDERHSVLVGKTDTDGRIDFAFDDGIPWKGVLWIVPEDGSAVVKVEPDDPTSGEEVKAVVRPGRVVQGTVTDQKGNGIAGAQVLVNVTSDEPEVDVGLYVYTDAKGTYRFPSLPFGDVSLEVDADGEWDTVDVDGEVKDNPLVRDFKIEVAEKEPPK